MPGEMKPKALYIADSLQQLNEKGECDIHNIRSIKGLCNTADKAYREADKAFKDSDEERAYVLFVKFMNMCTGVKKRKEYLKDKKFYDQLLGMKNFLKALEQTELLQKSLTLRYDDRKQENEIKERFALEEQEKREKSRSNKETEESGKEETPATDVCSNNIGQPHQRHSWTSSKYNSPHIPMVGARTGVDGSDIVPLCFHHVHGKHIQLSEDGKLASRVGSFCNVIVFTSRPIAVNEEVNMELIHSTNSWSGVLRFGFTQQNPARIALGALPKYACPDLTVKAGYWAKALRETYAGNGNLLTFYCNEYGEVYFKMDNSTYQLFFSDVDISSPLWALVDVYGNTTGVRLKESSPAIPHAVANPLPASPSTPQQHPTVDESNLPNATTQNTANTLPLQNYDTLDLERIHFHEVHGHSVRLRSHKKQARRKTDSYQGGIVFSERPLRIGEEIVIKIIEVSSKFVGHLGFGVTSCDPNILNLNDIPDELEALYDRPEFWAFSRDFPTPEERDTISFMVDKEGKVLCRIHGQIHGTLMHVDISQPLWAAFDVYGNTQVIRLLGIKHHSVIPQISPLEDEIPQPPVGSESDFLGMRELVENLYVHLDGANTTPEVLTVPEVPALPATKQEPHPVPPAPVQTQKTKPPRPPKQSADEGECTVCFEKSVNAVFYKCGHMCTCFECGKKLRLAGSPCPICRAYIKDVIKTFKS